MSLEPLKLRSRTDGDALASIDHGMLVQLSADLELWLDTEENGVVHDIEWSQELSVLLDGFVNRLDIFEREVDLVDVVLICYEVLVFQSRCVIGASFHKSTKRASLQIIDPLYIILIVETQCVSHEDQVNFVVVLHLNCVDTIDTREDGSGITHEINV